MKKRIAIILNSYPEIGGAFQYAKLICSALSESTRYEVIGICLNEYWMKWCREHNIKGYFLLWDVNIPQSNSLRNKNCTVTKYLNYNLTYLGNILKKERIDTVLCSSQDRIIFPLPVKIISPIHDLMHRYEGHFPEVSFDYDIRERIFTSQARNADVILVDSELGKKQYIESYGKIKKKNQRVEILPFVAPNYINDITDETIEVPDRFVFYPAQFWEHKNHINLIKAIEILKCRNVDTHLLLPGSDKNYGVVLRKYVIEHNLEDNVIFLGYISDGQLAYLYHNAVAMIMPSYFGPTNIPPLEAMSAGCPVAVSNKYAMPEQVGDAGLLFDPDSPVEIAECIELLLTDENKRNEMIEKGHNIVDKWSAKDFSKRLIEIIDV